MPGTERIGSSFSGYPQRIPYIVLVQRREKSIRQRKKVLKGRKLSEEELKKTSGGEECYGSDYLCPDCGDELSEVKYGWSYTLYYKCFNCGGHFAPEDIETY